jgi:hypothetical protein
LALSAPSYSEVRSRAVSACPLVSVIVRSVDRPELAEALGSLAAQTYPALEAVVVDARGGHGPLPEVAGQLTLKLVGEDRPLGHSRAANLGLDHARGRYVMLLDDDDLFLPEHVQRLVAALAAQPQARAAYGGVRVEGETRVIDVYDADVDPVRLIGWNHFPTAGVMFDRALTEQGVRFDEDLALYEDWDFWLQVAQHTAFARSPGVSAVYRPHLGRSGMIDAARAAELTAARHAVWRKWLPRLAPAAFETFVQSFRDDIAARDYRIAVAGFQERELRALLTVERAMSARTADVPTVAAVDHRLAEALARASALERTLNEVRASTSWRLTSPLRRAVDRMRGRRRS